MCKIMPISRTLIILPIIVKHDSVQEDMPTLYLQAGGLRKTPANLGVGSQAMRYPKGVLPL